MGTEYQIEAAACNGRGFSHVDGDGFCSKFKTWIQKSVASGGPGWYLIDDQSSIEATITAGMLTNSGLGNFTAAQVIDSDITTKAFDVDSASAGSYMDIDFGVGNTQDLVKMRLYMDAAGSTASWSVKYSDDGASYSDAETGLVASIAKWNFFEWTTVGAHRYWRLYLENTPGAGANIMEVELYTDTTQKNPYIVVSDVQNPNPNSDRPMIAVVSYLAAESGYVRCQHYLAWNNTAHIGRGLWSGHRMATYDDSDFAYRFAGGPYGSDHRGLSLMSRTGSTRNFSNVDEWTGVSSLVEADTVIGTLQSGISAGSNVTLQLDTGEAALFTANKYYYIYDMDGVTVCNYTKCVSVDTGTDQIILETISNTFAAGSVVGAYPHRFYSWGNGVALTNNMTYSNRTQIPYMSTLTGNYVIHNQTGYIYGSVFSDSAHRSLSKMDANDEGYWAVQHPLLCEEYRPNDGSITYEISMNRAYGCCNNIYLASLTSLTIELDGITVDGDNYLYIADASGYGFYASSSAIGIFILDTEHAT